MKKIGVFSNGGNGRIPSQKIVNTPNAQDISQTDLKKTEKSPDAYTPSSKDVYTPSSKMELKKAAINNLIDNLTKIVKDDLNKVDKSKPKGEKLINSLAEMAKNDLEEECFDNLNVVPEKIEQLSKKWKDISKKVKKGEEQSFISKSNRPFTLSVLLRNWQGRPIIVLKEYQEAKKEGQKDDKKGTKRAYVIEYSEDQLPTQISKMEFSRDGALLKAYTLNSACFASLLENIPNAQDCKASKDANITNVIVSTHNNLNKDK